MGEIGSRRGGVGKCNEVGSSKSVHLPTALPTRKRMKMKEGSTQKK
jgi:hypothetical protein